MSNAVVRAVRERMVEDVEELPTLIPAGAGSAIAA